MMPSIESEIEAAIYSGAISALRKRVKIEAERAKDGESAAGEKYPGVIIRTGESTIAESLATTFTNLADELEQEVQR